MRPLCILLFSLVFSEDLTSLRDIILLHHLFVVCLFSLPQLYKSHLISFQHKYPRTLEALVLYALSPLGAEILTRKFEEMDQIVAEEDRYLYLIQFCPLKKEVSICLYSLINLVSVGTISTRSFMVCLMINLLQWRHF